MRLLQSLGSFYGKSTKRRRRRCDTKFSPWIQQIAPSILSLSLLPLLSPLVWSFGTSNSFRYRPKQRSIHQDHREYQQSNYARHEHCDPTTFGACSATQLSSSLSSPHNYFLRELDNAYDLREGSLVLSRVEESLGCHDLRQPYFHKAVVLVLDHDPEDFTQGVLLNRSSDLTLHDRDIVYTEVGDNDGDEMYEGDFDFDGNFGGYIGGASEPPSDLDSESITSTETKMAIVEDEDDPSLLSSSATGATATPLSSNWRIHFGGDIGGWYEEVPQLLCIHGLSSEAALAVSDPIFRLEDGVFITSHFGAQSLVESGEATSDMFYTFSGFCGWEKDQLQREIDRGSWCLASFAESGEAQLDATVESSSSPNDDTKEEDNTESETKEQQHQHTLMRLIEKYSWKNPDYKPQSGGLGFWHDLMADLGKDSVEPMPLKITKSDYALPQRFSDLMVKEWSTQRLLVAKESGTKDNDDSGNVHEDEEFDGEEPVSQIDDADIFRALKAASGPTPVLAGSILRGSASSSPYVLSGQLFHKATILLLQETEEASVGVILNLPTKDAYILQIGIKDYNFPIRYGGPSGKEDEEHPYFWFHDSEILKDEGIGMPVSYSNDNPERNDPRCIYACELEDVQEAIECKLASEDDFLLVQGFCAWEKETGLAGGVTGELLNGNLENAQLRTTEKREKMWKALLRQKQLMSEDCLRSNLALSLQAWKHGGEGPIDEDQNGSRRVFESTVDIKQLADDALFVWMKIFLLGNGVYYPEDL